MRGLSRRRPYPFDFVIAGTGLMAGQAKKGADLVARKSQDMSQVAPTDFAYSSLPPQWGRVMPYEDLSGGIGLKMQQAWEDKQSRYCLNADTSMGRVWLKGPDLGTITPSVVDDANGISEFFEIGGVLFALNGRYVQRRSSDLDWNTGRYDFGEGKAAQDVAVFYSNGLAAEYAYIAMGDAEHIYRFDGTNFVQHASLFARALCAVGREFYRAHDTNLLAKVDVDADPWDAANWGADNAFRVGDKSAGINRLAVTVTGAMLVLKADGIWSLDEVGQDHNLYPFLALGKSDGNGKGCGPWMNDLYVPYGQTLCRVKSDFSIERVDTETATDDGPVQGPITCFLGHETFHGYGGRYNPDTGDSYLMKFTRADRWHGSITPAFAGKKITALHKSRIGAPAGHHRLYLGFSDGSVAWFTLPCAANPAACDQYTFSTADGRIYFPLATFLFHADRKAFQAVTVEGLNLSASNYAQFEYRTDLQAAHTPLGVDFTGSPRQEAEFPNDTAGSLLDHCLVLKSLANTSCPQITALAIRHAVRPALVLTYEFSILAVDGLAKRDGTPLRLGAEQIKRIVRNVMGVAGSVQVILPDESNEQLSLVDYSETLAWDERLRQWRAALAVRAVQYKLNTLYGTHARLQAYSHAALQGYTHRQLMAI